MNIITNTNSNKPLKILMSRWHFNIRLAKQALALRNVFGCKTYIAISNCFEEHRELIEKCFDGVFWLTKDLNIKKSIEILKDVIIQINPNIITSHQEPNFIFSITSEALKALKLNIPNIFEVHDMTSYRRPELTPSNDYDVSAEKYAFENADGIVVIAPEVYDYARSKYNIKVPFVTIRGFTSIDMYPKLYLHKLPGKHIVYEGGLACRDLSLGDTWLYRYYLPQFRLLTQQGFHVHAYPGDTTHDKCWEYIEEEKLNPFFHLHPQTTFLKLIEEMTQYHYGLASFNFDNTAKRTYDFLHNTTPNKVWEYLAAGLPSIVNNFNACARLVEKYRIGFECKDLSNLMECIELNKNKLVTNIEYSKELCLENFIWELERFYRLIIERNNKK